MKTPLLPPASALTGEALLTYYAIARRAGEAIYDESWVAPPFRTWRRGKRKRSRANHETGFDELVRLGVLEKVEGPILPEPNATPLALLNLPETSYDGRDYQP